MNAANTSMLVHGGRAYGALGRRLGAGLRSGGRWMRRASSPGARTSPARPSPPIPRSRPTARCGTSATCRFPRPMLIFYRIDPAGRLAKVNVLPMAPLGLTHDFVVTERRLVVLLTPFVLDRGQVRFRPHAHPRRPCLAPGARRARAGGGQGQPGGRAPPRAAARLPFPSRQWLGGRRTARSGWTSARRRTRPSSPASSAMSCGATPVSARSTRFIGRSFSAPTEAANMSMAGRSPPTSRASTRAASAGGTT